MVQPPRCTRIRTNRAAGVEQRQKRTHLHSLALTKQRQPIVAVDRVSFFTNPPETADYLADSQGIGKCLAAGRAFFD